MDPVTAEVQLYMAGVYITLSVLLIILFWDIFYIARRKRSDHPAKKSFPSVSIIIPAHNESAVLPNTLKNIFASDYPRNKMQVIVVDDGSSDDTAKVAKKFGATVVKNRTNLGKCKALNVGIENASNDLIVTTDADTEFAAKTVESLVKHFSDRKVGAVAGYYKTSQMSNFSKFSLGNLKTFLLVKFQSLEYMTFLFARRRQAAFDAIMVVPGSIGAFRKDVLKKIGGFDPTMLIEDYDATIKIHKAGYKVVCDREALAWTKPPLNLRQLFKQRTRWYRGGFEVLAKHSDLISSRHGFVPVILALEYVTIFLQIAMFAFVGASFYERVLLLHQNIFQLAFDWLFGLIHLKPIDVFGAVIISMFAVTFSEAYFSVKVSKSSLKTLIYFPIISIYLTILGFIWFYSLIAHVTKRRVDMKAHAWKTTAV